MKTHLTKFQLDALLWLESSPPATITKGDFGRRYYREGSFKKFNGIKNPATYVGGSLVKILVDRHYARITKHNETKFVEITDIGRDQLNSLRRLICG